MEHALPHCETFAPIFFAINILDSVLGGGEVLDHLKGSISGAVYHHDHFPSVVLPAQVVMDRLEHPPNTLLFVIGRNYDREVRFHKGGPACWGLRMLTDRAVSITRTGERLARITSMSRARAGSGMRNKSWLLDGRLDWPVPFTFGLINRGPAASAEDAGHKICAIVQDFDNRWVFERIEFDPATEPIEPGLRRPVLGPSYHADWHR